jgi:hypothetical protein
MILSHVRSRNQISLSLPPMENRQRESICKVTQMQVILKIMIFQKLTPNRLLHSKIFHMGVRNHKLQAATSKISMRLKIRIRLLLGWLAQSEPWPRGYPRPKPCMQPRPSYKKRRKVTHQISEEALTEIKVI